jgi:hypothetical protein
MKSIRLLAALLALATGAFAQDNNAAKLALAREAIAAVKADKMFDSMMAQMKQMSSQMAANALPSQATPEQRKKFEEFQGKIMDLSMESAKGMIAQMDQIYADVYSEAELNAMVAFFKSAEGQSMLAKQPQIMQRMMPLMQSMQRDLMPRIKELTAQFEADLKAAKAQPEAAAAPAQKP